MFFRCENTFTPKSVSGYIVLILTIIMAAALAGCGGGGGGAVVTAPTTPTGDTITVTGRVIAPFGADRDFASKLIDVETNLDLNGSPLAGATVSVQGTSVTGATDSMGNFTLTGVPADKELVLSASKSGLVLYKGIGPSSDNRNVIVNYQTSAVQLYYDEMNPDLPPGEDVEWLESRLSRMSGLLEAADIFEQQAIAYGTGESSTPPHQFDDFTEAIESSDITTPPYLYDISYSATTVAPGGSFTIDATVYCPEVVTDFSIYIQHEDDYHISNNWSGGASVPARYLYESDFELPTKSGNRQELEMTIDVPPYFPEGRYYVQMIQFRDNGSNYAYYTGVEEGELFGSYEFMDLPVVTISQAASDTTEPELVSASLSKNAISSVNDRVLLTVAVKDTQSGVRSIRGTFDFYPSGSTDYTTYTWSASIYDDSCDDNGTCTVTQYFYGSSLDRYGSGTFYFNKFYAIDAANNIMSTTYSGIELESTLPLEASSPSYKNEFAENLTLDSVTVTAGLGSSAQVSVSANYAGDATQIRASVTMAAGEFENFSGNNLNTISMYLTSNESTGKWEGSGTFNYNDFVSDTDLFPRIIDLYSDSTTAYERSRYLCYISDDDVEEDEFRNCTGLDITSITIPSHSREDTDYPTLTSFTLGPTSVSNGGEVDLTLNISENGSGLRRAYVYFECDDCSDEYEYDTISFSMEIFDYLGSGAWQGSVSIPISQRKSRGVWILDRISVYDFAGNYRSYYYSSYSDPLENYTTGSAEFYVE